MRQNPPTENGPVVRFYLRDAMLARVLAMDTCLSMSSVLSQVAVL